MAKKQRHDRPKSRLRKSFARAARRAALAGALTLSAFGCATVRPPALPAPPDNPVTAQLVSPADTADYALRLFSRNAASALTEEEKARMQAMTARERLSFYMDRLCFTAGETLAAGSEGQLRLSETLDSLARLTLLGRPLVDLAIENRIRLCALDNLPPGFAAQYLPDYDAVAAGPQAAREGRVLMMAHEILHAAQERQGLLGYSYNWDLRSRVTRNLSVEAAAEAAEYLIAFEAKLAGDNSYWDYMGGRRGDSRAMKNLIETRYNAALQEGASQYDALRAAGRAAWENMFNSAGWRDFYLNEELGAFLRDIGNGRFDGARRTGYAQFGQDRIDRAGAIGDLPGFTAGGRFPGYESIIGASPKMRWAFEAAEIARLRRMANGDAAAEALRAQALAGGNPYLELDIAGIHARLRAAGWSAQDRHRYFHEHLDDALKTPPPPAPRDATAVARAPLPPVPPS